MPHKPLRILTWHVHGNYLYYLTQVPHEWYVLSKPDRPAGYAGRSGELPWGENVHDLPVEELASAQLDCVVYQSSRHWEDRAQLLTEEQRRLPRVLIEHDPPQGHPTNTLHPMQDPDGTLVHVTSFNRLMWDNGVTPTRVIDHGVVVPGDVHWNGRRAEGIVVANNLARRGRRLGLDVYREARSHVPLALIGMDAESEGGIGEVRNVDVAAFMSQYRFYFHPCRYSSLGLSLCEAMAIGMPIVGLATTELVTVIRNGENGYVDTNVGRLIDVMRTLLADPELAARWGTEARVTARRRFHIDRFVADWMELLAERTGMREERAAA